MWTRAMLKDKAKYLLKENYWKCVLVGLISAFVSGGFSSGYSAYASNNNVSGRGSIDWSDPRVISFISIMLIIVGITMLVSVALVVFLYNPLIVGVNAFFVCCDRQRGDLNQLGSGFRNYKRVVGTMFLRDMYISLWSLLFIIPGIIKGYEYAMVPYLLAQHPELDSKEVFALSKQMMYGEKWNTFVLDWSFFGWNLLALFTFGILNVFYVTPYQNLTLAQLYIVLEEKMNCMRGTYGEYQQINYYAQDVK